jgi:hypothetical protein
MIKAIVLRPKERVSRYPSSSSRAYLSESSGMVAVSMAMTKTP